MINLDKTVSLSPLRVPAIVQSHLPISVNLQDIAAANAAKAAAFTTTFATTDIPVAAEKAATTSARRLLNRTMNINLRRRKRSVDPLLNELFGGGDEASEATTQPPKMPKPKPSFTDGRKLDNSRDWERVKVARPPPEELRPAKKKETKKEEDEDVITIEDILGGDDEDQEEAEEPDSIEDILGGDSTASEEEQELDREMTTLRKDIQESEELLSRLEEAKKHARRSKRSLGSRYGDSYDTPPRGARPRFPQRPDYSDYGAVLPAPRVRYFNGIDPLI